VRPSYTLVLNEALTQFELGHSREVASPAYYGIDLGDLKVKAASDNRAGIMDISSTGSRSFYIRVMGTDTMYNQSNIDIFNCSTMGFSSPVHRWYQSKKEFAHFGDHHHLQFSKPAM
jgi:hypothetical protein